MNSSASLPKKDTRRMNYGISGNFSQQDSAPSEPRLPDDYSDVASQNSQQSSSQRRKHQRGGRRSKGKSKEKQQAAESQKPWSERTGRLQPVSESHFDSSVVQGEQQDQEPKIASKDLLGSNRTRSDLETGATAFNLKRAEGSSGARPIGVSIELEELKKSKAQNHRGRSKSRKAAEESHDEGSGDQGKEKRKPLAIRLDLNLELEIFLRAKVKGDITITFLE